MKGTQVPRKGSHAREQPEHAPTLPAAELRRPPVPAAAGCSLRAGLSPRGRCAIHRRVLLARRLRRPRRPSQAVPRAMTAAPPPASSSSSTACCPSHDSSFSSTHVVEQCIDLRSLTGKNETLAIYLFMVRSTAEISYKLRLFLCYPVHLCVRFHLV